MYCVPATASVAQVQFLIADLVILHYSNGLYKDVFGTA